MLQSKPKVRRVFLRLLAFDSTKESRAYYRRDLNQYPTNKMSSFYDDDQPLTAFSLTHIQYRANDPLGLLMAVASLLPILMLVVYLTLIVSRRDLATIYITVGQIGTEIVNYVLKHWIKESRPIVKLHKGYGMPSSHAQFMTYWAAIVSLWILYRLRFRVKIFKFIIISIVYLTTIVVCYSRVYLQYHTVKQVLIGSVVGTLCGTMWYLITVKILLPFKVINVSNPIMKYLYIRDTTNVAYLFEHEYLSISNYKNKRID